MEDDTIWTIYELSKHLHVHASSLMRKTMDLDIYFLVEPL